MNAKAFYSAIAALGMVLFGSHALGIPVTVSLGAAGPGNWAILDIGNGNVSIASPGSITGNVGVNGGNLSDSGTPIQGNVYTSGSGVVSLSGGANVSGTTSQNSALLSSDATLAKNASAYFAALPSSGSVSVPSGGTVALSAVVNSTNVYDLTNLILSNTTLDLTPGANYVFNISGSLALSQSQILDSTPADVVFNITGTQGVALSGGSVLDGVILAPNAGFSESGGSVVGEIISGGTISISGAKIVDPPPTVPDSGSSLFLLGIGIVCLGVECYRRRFRRSLAS